MNATENVAGSSTGESNFRVILRLLRYMRPFNTIMFISLTTRIIRFAAQAAVLAIAAASIGIYMESFEPGVVRWDIIWTQVKWIAVAGTVMGLMSYLETYTGHYVAFRVLASFRDRFYFAMLPLAPAKTAKLQSGDAVSRVMADCDRIEPFYAHTIAPAVSAVFVPPVLLFWCWTVHPSLVWVLAPLYALTTFFLPWLVARLGGDGIEYRQQLGEVNAFVSDSIQGVRDTVAFGYEKHRAATLWRTGETMGARQDKLYGADAIQRALAEVFVTVGIIIAAWWSIELALAGEISMLIELPAVIAVSVIGFYTAVGLANNYTDFRVSIFSARRLFAMMDQAPAVHETVSTEIDMPADTAIHFRDVEFQYDADDADWSRERKVFDGLSMDIVAGRHVALVGPSGTGKSTVVNLLLRQWDPQRGSILIGDQSVTEFPLAELQSVFAVVSQRSYIFNDTIRENIRLGCYDATDAEIEAAVDRSGLREFVASLPDGLDAPAGERGGKLSGGQRQRVAIARAMLKAAPIVLLDEATSSLDVETEASVLSALRVLGEGRTTLTIAHRLSTIAGSDEIFVMLEGRIAERGTHHELMARDGWYARMFTLQQDEVDVALGA